MALSGDDYVGSIFWPLEEVLIVLTQLFFESYHICFRDEEIY